MLYQQRRRIFTYHQSWLSCPILTVKCPRRLLIRCGFDRSVAARSSGDHKVGATSWFGLLGPVEARIGGRRVPLGGPRARSILAALLLEADRVVPLDAIVEMAWGNDAPDTARFQTQNRVSALRRALRESGGDDTIETVGSSYVIRVEPNQLDIQQFDSQLRDARRLMAAAELAPAAQTLASALRLWRGPSLHGLDTPRMRAAASRLDETRLTAQELLVDLNLRCGRHHEIIGELLDLGTAHPWREHAACQLMLALYRAGRRREALDTFVRTTHLLRSELGIDPGHELVHLRDQILRDDAALTLSRPVEEATPAAVVTRPASPAEPEPPAKPESQGAEPVRMLPRAVPNFVGRDHELETLDAVMQDVPTVPLCIIAGPPGVGKTALAVHWAHRSSHDFPGGQLFVNLRGYGPGGPVRAAEALTTLLVGLGVAPDQIPGEEDAAVARYRSLLADRTILVVLDDAASADQVRPLLPPGPRSAVVVTSRDRLTGLTALDGARPMKLSMLSLDEAVELLRQLVGDARAADESAIVDLATVCGRLPMALRIAATQLKEEADVALADYVADLRMGRPLNALAVAGDESATVRTALAQSYRRLEPAAARLLRLMGLLPVPDISTESAAALIDDDAGSTAKLLDLLVMAHLAERREPDRFGLHDLVRDYAAERASAEETAAARTDAVRRLFTHLASGAVAASRRAFPNVAPLMLAEGTGGFRDEAAALAWLDVELPSIVAVAMGASDAGVPELAWRSEAFAAYRRASRRSAELLGVPPGPALQALHSAMLRGNAPVDTTTPAITLTAASWRLPNPLADFVGRRQELDLIGRTVRARLAQRQSNVIAVNGLAGVGKTSLALSAARDLYAAFPAGQLHADLRGHEEPRSTRDIVHAFLGQLGVTGSNVPDDLEQASARYRELLSASPRLVLLDNASSAAQVQPLLAPIDSLTIVTSRPLLADLDGARFITVAPLTIDESVELLRRVLGDAADGPGGATVARLCGMLPLAVRLAAIRCLTTGTTLDELAGELRDDADRLANLSSEERSVGVSIMSSYRQLKPAQRDLLCGLAATTDGTFPAWVAEPILDANTDRATAELARLLDSGLVERAGLDPAGTERYRLHDLVRAFARTVKRDSGSEEELALRCADAWAAMTDQADAGLVLNRATFTVNRSTFRYRPSVGSHVADPMAWFGVELVNLRHVLDLCAAYGLDEYHWQLCWNLEAYLRRVARLSDVIDISERGLAAAVRVDDPRGIACMRLSLGGAYLLVDDLERAMDQASSALTVAQGLADDWLTAEILGVLAQVHAGRGELGQQAVVLPRAIELYERAGDDASAGTKLTALGELHATRGATDLATAAFARGIELLRRAEAVVPLARGLRQLGQAHAEAGDHDLAIPLLEEALQLVRRAGEPIGDLCLSTELAICHSEQGEPDRARPHAHTARRLADQIDMPLYRSYATTGHGAYLAAAGREDLALGALQEALPGLAAVKLWQITCRYHIGRLQLRRGAIEAGITTLREGQDEATRMGAVALAQRFVAVAERARASLVDVREVAIANPEDPRRAG